jgi:hypothetical protein
MVTSLHRREARSLAKQPRKSVVKLEEKSRSPHKAVEENPLYGVAMLRIAVEVKKHGTRELDGIIRQVLTKMRLSEEDFRGYLSANGGLLRRIAEQ